MKTLWARLKKEKVLLIAAAAAAISCCIVPPSAAYLDYIDRRVLGLLWCLMVIVAGFRSAGLFDRLTDLLLRDRGSTRRLSVLLVLLPFFLSMAVTNDVALIAFVPFTIQLLAAADCEKAMIPMLVLQTLAANLGSMATPVGNPQNLFLYGYYNLSPGEFFRLLLPLTALSLVLLTAAALPVLPKKMPVLPAQQPHPLARSFWLYLLLFLFALLAVTRILPWYIVFALVLVSVFFADRPLLREADYFLLLTFVCFFVFSGNLGNMAGVRAALQSLLEKNTMLTALAASQLISNVPAAVLLAPFTEDYQGLLLGVDIGGLGTPVASLASLITLKFYSAYEHARPGRYLLWFTLACLAGLLLLVGAALLWF